MRLVTLSQSESGTQESTKKFDLLDIGLKLRIDGSLGSLSGLGGDSGLLGSVEQSLLTLLDDLLLASEEGIIDLGDIDAIDRHLGGGGNDVSLVDTAKRNSVDAIRT